MKNRTLGVCTWTLGITDLEEMMAHIASLGMNGVQYCEHHDDHPADAVRAAAQAHGLELIIFDPFDCGPGDRNGAATLGGAIAFYKRAIDYAAQLGCGQTLQGLSAWTQGCDGRQEGWAFLVEALKALSSYASDKGVALAYEPCNLYEVAFIHTAAEYQQLMEDSGCEEIQILLDSFHMNIGEPAPLEALVAYAHKNAVYHISDSNREGMGRGHIDFAAHHRVLRRAGYQGPCVMEFVLKDNPVNTPPQDPAQLRALSGQLRHSVQAWRRLERA